MSTMNRLLGVGAALLFAAVADCDSTSNTQQPMDMAGAPDLSMTTGDPDLGAEPDLAVGPDLAVTPPTLTSATPALVPSTGATMVAFTGTNIESGATLKVGGTAATNLQLTPPTSLLADVPAKPAACGPVAVELTNPSGGKVTTSTILSYFLTTTAYKMLGLNTPSLVDAPEAVAIGDITGDKLPDLVFTTTGAASAGSITMLSSNGAGNYNVAKQFTTGKRSPRGVALADINNDGKLDVLVPHFGDPTVVVRASDGTGALTQLPDFTVTGTVAPTLRALQVADMDGDKNLDLIIGDAANDRVVIALGDGKGNFVQKGAYATGFSTSAAFVIAVGLFDGDKFPDIAISGGSGSAAALLLNDGTGALKTATALGAAGSNPRGIAAGDFNKDGKLDLAVASLTDSTITLYTGNGLGVLTKQATLVKTGTGPREITTADINCDGNLDLISANSKMDNVSVLVGNGMLGFVEKQFPTGAAPGVIAAADLNNDGRIDIAVANDTPKTATVLLNDGQ